MTPSADFDVVVIGAGAAGLAAAARLASAELNFVVLEARNRIGGRAFTRVAGGFPLDLGCGWLHAAERNPWTAIAQHLGFTIDRTRPPWGTLAFDPSFSREDQEEFFAESAAFDVRLAAAARLPEDRPASASLIPGNRWNGLLDAISTYYSGVELDRLSTHDYEAYREDGVNWRVLEGLGAAVARFGEAFPIRRGTPALSIDHSGRRLSIATSQGEISASAVIVTVPTAHISEEKLRFVPPVPAKIEAAAALPLGLADKLVLCTDTPEDLPPELPKDSRLFGHTDRAETGSYHVRPFGRPILEGYFGGENARRLEAEGERGFVAAAQEELARHLGRDVCKRLRPIACSTWALEPFSLGAYSYARPGGAGSREILAAPIDGRLFFAGEATSPRDFSTVHGAYQSGLRAADEVLSELLPGAWNR